MENCKDVGAIKLTLLFCAFLLSVNVYLILDIFIGKRQSPPEETVALLLRDLERKGWIIEYNIPVPKYGDADAFLRLPSGSCFVVDSKVHGGTVFFNGIKLMRRYGKEVYEFDNNKDLLKAVKGQAVHLKKAKGVKYVITILCFTKAKLDIQAIDNKVQDVYVHKPESLVRLLRRLDSK